MMAKFGGCNAGKQGFGGGPLAIDEDRDHLVPAFAEGTGGRLDDLAHFVLAIEFQGAAGVGDGFEDNVIGAAIEHAIDVVRVISLDIAANEGGDVGHLGS